MSGRGDILAASEARIRELEAALQEANETLDAIRNGDVDAVIVGGPQGHVVYTLENADRPYRVLVEQMREGAVTMNGQGTVLYCNQSFAELVGRRSEDIIGDPIVDYVEETADLAAMLTQSGPEGVSAEMSLRLASGGVAQANLSVVNMVVEAGEASMLCMIVTDLRANYERAREVAQANLRLGSEIVERMRVEQSLAIALDAADMGSWDLDIAADTSVRSHRHDAIFGYAELRTSWGLEDTAKHFLPEDRQAFVDAITLAQTTGRLDVERRILRASDGAVRWVQVKGRTFFRDGHPERIVGIIVDNTERRLLDEALRQGQKMEAIGQLTGGIAHDFNNLLMIIGGSLESLSRRVQLDDRVQRLLDAARLGVERGARLNEQLLAFARRQDMRQDAVCVTDLLPTFETLLDRAIGEAVRVSVHRTPNLWYCQTDPNQLEIAILNLAINARDAMNERGELVLSTGNVKITHQQAEPHEAGAGDYVKVSISDNGPGMAPEIAARVFEPFFTTKAVGKGTGLGLSQVYGFARQSGGFVELDSTPGAGTTVSIFLPRTEAPLTSAVADTFEQASKYTEGLALLVEDDTDVRVATRSMLEELGYRVIEAESADTALELIEGGCQADFVFSDVIMGIGMTGIEMARSLKSSHPELPVLLTSGYTAQRLVPKAMNDDLPLLRKPYTLTQLAEALAKLRPTK
ncbi:ATP-binding protein [Beijerinckia sp. L45]|uniref:ATP-binding protein n=1 Tax=Beijerinckia sp. L45 TaxID=1641855 RepID=UPI00131C717C|nr:ATP-binding protein [Beijerinckia sp. L45]